MEDTLREVYYHSTSFLANVLILVLMEDTLRVAEAGIEPATISCLNPCFNGRYS